ncbi:MAG: glycosyltransferase family 2 protein [Gammaproteobacteria bacterium]|nr:glycosyltransferase family 2 protein [Gammaproteobacteria bacterium]
MNISLCIATYRRNERLGALLDDLVKQQLLPEEVVVVDNDAAGSARDVVERRRAMGAPFTLVYDIQPQKNISLTRNRTVQLARGEWIAFIDDDERAPPPWLKLLADSVVRYHADGALGPVDPVVPADAPAWIRHGHFYAWARMQTGDVVPINKLRFGNVLLRGALLRRTPTPFDPAYGLTGGEDGDLLGRLAQAGARIVWCDEAIVHEPIESARLRLRWLLLRALRGGQDFARHKLSGSYGQLTLSGRVRLFLRALLQSAAAAGLALLAWPRGRHRAVYWLLKLSANLGKMSIFLGWHYREYGGKAT